MGVKIKDLSGDIDLVSIILQYIEKMSDDGIAVDRREIHDHVQSSYPVDVSMSNVYLILKRLHDRGIITSSHVGRKCFYYIKED